MINLTQQCFKCPLEQCIKCNGAIAKRQQLVNLIQIKERLIHLGANDKIDLTACLSKLKQVESRIAILQSN